MLITIGFDEQESLDVFALDLTRTIGTPVDSFEARLLWSAGAADAARSCERVRIYADGKLVFTGVADEVSVEVGAHGRVLEVAGRGLAAVMMRVEQSGREFAVAGWADIKKRLVDECGIVAEAEVGELSSLRRFAITSGVSSWKALCDWAGAAGMIAPGFSAEGVLLLRRKGSGLLKLDAASAIFAAERRTVRDGAVSEVLVRERATGRQTVVKSDELKALGVNGRAVIAASKGALESKIPAARWVLEQSRRGFDRFSVELAGGFMCEPGDAVECSVDGLPEHGRVDSVRTIFGEDGVRCVVEGFVE